MAKSCKKCFSAGARDYANGTYKPSKYIAKSYNAGFNSNKNSTKGKKR